MAKRADFSNPANSDYLVYALEQRHAVQSGTLAPDVREELDKLMRCDLLVLNFPIYWFSVPAMLKGWIDRVLVSGRVYGGMRFYDRGDLKGKRALVCASLGGQPHMFGPGTVHGTLEDMLRHLLRGTLAYRGLSVLPPFFAHHVPYLSDADRAAIMQRLRERLRTLDMHEALPTPTLDDFDARLHPLPGGPIRFPFVMNANTHKPIDTTITLDDKYTASSGRVYMSGTQALVRLPMLQQERDRQRGLRTAGFISGYRGSPLGGYDQALLKAKDHLDRHHIRFLPGVNEELAVTAAWGTQQANLKSDAKYDGVFALWYGKGPGVDRSADALRHANQAGTSAHGGVLALAGDDHSAKSSTMAAQTDHLFQAVSMPVLAPATVQDFIDLGLHGIAMSRFSGLWVGFKCVTDCVESTGVVDLSPERVQPVLPEHLSLPEGGLNIRWPEQGFVAMEQRLNRHKLPAALAYARANRLDRTHFASSRARRGIVTSGKSYLDVMQALDDLGIDAMAAHELGLKVYQVAMPWPLEPLGLSEFSEDCEELLVVEEKRDLMEGQIKQILYGQPGAPRVMGKRDRQGDTLLPDAGEIDPAMVARVIAAWLGLGMGAAARRVAQIEHAMTSSAALKPTVNRTPYFCSGCPHNSSTKVPEGSRALAGIGCHYMAQWMDRETETFTHMGGEGANWVGQAAFVHTAHVFQNLGDGTYFHSGYLAIRQAVAAGTAITYKVLFNDAVAMTGGQEHDGTLTPAAIARQVLAEGVREVVVVTDEPDKYPKGYFPSGVSVHPRTELDAVQRRLREVRAVTVLVFDQTCAAEKRRRRKKGTMATQPRRAFIHAAVCEGCGDCGVQSNCVSVEPLDTELGRKRRINQSSCNQDLTCVQGFCPSFVTVTGGQLRKGKGVAASQAGKTLPALPTPSLPALEGRYAVLVTGIGGTGVVTIGQVLGMAAHLEGKAANVLDMTGMAQKGGAVTSHVQFAPDASQLRAPKLAMASADAVIGCDLLVTGSQDVLAKLRPGHTRVVVNTNRTPTGDFTRDTQWELPADQLQQAIRQMVGEENNWAVDAGALATGLLGDALATNLFLLGFAWQKGALPLSDQAIEKAIQLNGVAVPMNLQAFRWGRAAAADLAKVEALARPAQVIQFVPRKKKPSLEELIAHRTALLVKYQDERYAQRYQDLVTRVADAEAGMGQTKLTEAVARGYAKLLAYKDEYEVARLFADPAFAAELAHTFEGDYRIAFNLAPPLMPRRDGQGRMLKREFGPWMLHGFRWLARLKRLRGTPFDVFGHTAERREERRLIAAYESSMEQVIAGLNLSRHALAVHIAALPEKVRGFGHVKQHNIDAFHQEQAALLKQFRSLPDRGDLPQAA
ncbi:indolepyruvate ferredoxin oxidoreductase family protein [Hydrogenophaga palleronii]|uniref:indolepyruvate ferredoxin oxidoreductase family protein n=1 Tax=Hydrogenophaga palleronii TaxID=65655 RepID=UPI0009FD4CCD|nr:indolepyruvate ferredoxin oxidoreductase family protein [Hydrogenophaga palleronii]